MYWHRSNSDILTLVYTTCHTVDHAYFQLKYLWHERQDFIAYTLANNKRTLAEVVQAKAIAEDEGDTRQHRLLAEYSLDEAAALHPGNKRRVDYARKEAEFIQSLLDKLERHRNYTDLDDFAAEQQAAFDNSIADLLLNVYYDLCSLNMVTAERYKQAKAFACFERLLGCINALRVKHADLPPEKFLLMTHDDILGLLATSTVFKILPKTVLHETKFDIARLK